MKKFLISLAAIVCCTLMVATLASCGDDDNEPTGPFHYSMGFSRIESSDALTEMGIIEDAFFEALGVDDTKFQYDSDAQVASACKKAESTLKGVTLKGSYTFVVTNESTQKKVYTWSN